MKICITAKEPSLDASVDPRFGRCNYFVIVNTDTLEFEAFENENKESQGGAGIKAGQFVAGKGVKVVLTENIGPNASETLKASGIEIIVGVSGTVKEAVEKYKQQTTH